MICNGTSKYTKAVISFSDNGPEAAYICGPIILPNGSYTGPDLVSVDGILQYESLYVCVCLSQSVDMPVWGQSCCFLDCAAVN